MQSVRVLCRENNPLFKTGLYLRQNFICIFPVLSYIADNAPHRLNQLKLRQTFNIVKELNISKVTLYFGSNTPISSLENRGGFHSSVKYYKTIVNQRYDCFCFFPWYLEREKFVSNFTTSFSCECNYRVDSMREWECEWFGSIFIFLQNNKNNA